MSKKSKLKLQIEDLKFEKAFLTEKVEKLLLKNGDIEKILKLRNKQIVNLEKILKSYDIRCYRDENKSDTFFSLDDAVKFRENLKEQKGFSSRFMPNVKFKVPKHLDNHILHYSDGGFSVLLKQCAIDSSGVLFSAILDNDFYNSLSQKVVSIYEAIPEYVLEGFYYNKKEGVLLNLNEVVTKSDGSPVIPDGMVYDKESDSLVAKKS